LSVVVSIRIDLANTAPVANPDAIDASTGIVTLRPLDNDTDPDGDPLQLQSFPTTITFTNGDPGTLTAVGTDQLSIDPGTGGGIATFTYTAVDNGGLVSAPATVTVRVNRRPLAGPVQQTVDPDVETVVALAASDPDGDALVVSLDGVPADVVVTIAGLVLNVTVPTGYSGSSFMFDYTVTDPSGLAATAVVTIDVTGTPPTTTSPPTTTTLPPPPTT
jgi:hypothetical protein